MNKTVLCMLYLLPIISIGQTTKVLPRIENDTLFTKSGYKMYKGLQMHFGLPSGDNGHFRYINEFERSRAVPMSNNVFTILEVEKLAVSGLENIYVYVEAEGGLSPEGKTKFTRTFKINFDKAIQDLNGKPAELIVPEEFKGNMAAVGPVSVADELTKLSKLYKDSVITKDEYEAQKKKLLAK